MWIFHHVYLTFMQYYKAALLHIDKKSTFVYIQATIYRSSFVAQNRSHKPSLLQNLVSHPRVICCWSTTEIIQSKQPLSDTTSHHLVIPGGQVPLSSAPASAYVNFKRAHSLETPKDILFIHSPF